MIKIEKLTKFYNDKLAIKDISTNIKKGEIFGFIGPNGAGKSTTMNCVMNFINKNSGSISVLNNDVNDKNYIIKEDIGYLPSEINLYEDLTVIQMINYSKSFYKKCDDKLIRKLITVLKIEENKKIGTLSYGNLKKVGIILALLHNPKIVIMDEPTNGLDPLMQEEFYKILLELKENGKTIFLSSHNLEEIKKLCDRVAIIKNGLLIEVTTVKELMKDNFVNVSITSKEMSKFISKIDGSIINKDKNSISFIYRNDINELLKTIKDYKIERLLIEEPSIEEIFMHFYQEEV